MMNQTFSIIKPDATKRNITGSINKVIEDSGLRIIAQKRIKLSTEQAESFYYVHKERPFFSDLVQYMCSEPVIVQVLSGENCVEKYRSIMGATNPENADMGTIRKLFALNVQENSVHGSDSEENAKIEISFFFQDEEIVG
jgi:nucleoside-diphosphate kinase